MKPSEVEDEILKFVSPFEQTIDTENESIWNLITVYKQLYVHNTELETKNRLLQRIVSSCANRRNTERVFVDEEAQYILYAELSHQLKFVLTTLFGAKEPHNALVSLQTRIAYLDNIFNTLFVLVFHSKLAGRALLGSTKSNSVVQILLQTITSYENTAHFYPLNKLLGLLCLLLDHDDTNSLCLDTERKKYFVRKKVDAEFFVSTARLYEKYVAVVSSHESAPAPIKDLLRTLPVSVNKPTNFFRFVEPFLNGLLQLAAKVLSHKERRNLVAEVDEFVAEDLLEKMTRLLLVLVKRLDAGNKVKFLKLADDACVFELLVANIVAFNRLAPTKSVGSAQALYYFATTSVGNTQTRLSRTRRLGRLNQLRLFQKFLKAHRFFSCRVRDLAVMKTFVRLAVVLKPDPVCTVFYLKAMKELVRKEDYNWKMAHCKLITDIFSKVYCKIGDDWLSVSDCSWDAEELESDLSSQLSC